MESYNHSKANGSAIDAKLISELIAAIDQKNIMLVDSLVSASSFLPSYEAFWRTLRKVPNEALRVRYLKELKTLLTLPTLKFPLLTESENKYIESRKLWSDVVSATDQLNESYKMQVDVKTKLYERLGNLGYQTPSVLLEKCLKHLQDHSALVVTFNASMLKKGLSDFQLLNMFEKGISHDDWYADYQRHRTLTEEGLFSRLDSHTSIALQQNPLAKPRYGALILLDASSSITPCTYGKSFLVLKNIVKYNSLFLAKDSLNYLVDIYGDNPTRKSLTPATFHHLEILLLECGDKKLKSIIDWVITGAVPKDYSHQNPHYRGIEEHGYIEVLLPSVNILDASLVERIHIDQTELAMSPEDLGLSVVSELTASELKRHTYYPHYHSSRFHLFTVYYNNKDGDKAKSTILDEYKDELDKITNELELEQFSEKLESDPRYKILCTGQGLTTQFFNLFCHAVKTSSEHALEEMIDLKRRVLALEKLTTLGYCEMNYKY